MIKKLIPMSEARKQENRKKRHRYRSQNHINKQIKNDRGRKQGILPFWKETKTKRGNSARKKVSAKTEDRGESDKKKPSNIIKEKKEAAVELFPKAKGLVPKR